MKSVFEARDVTVYKRLIKALGDYSSQYGFTGVDQMFKKAVEAGKKILPKNKEALGILDYIVSDESSSGCVQKLLNTRFTELPAEVRPIAKVGKRKEVAFWEVGDRLGDKVVNLLNLDGKGGGRWVTAEGEKVTLVPLQTEEDKE